MDNDFGPHFDTSLFGHNNRLMRLHKGGSIPKPIPPPPPKGQVPATTVAISKDRRIKNRGATANILTAGMDNFGNRSILGG